MTPRGSLPIDVDVRHTVIADLVNMGRVALLQDLAVVAKLGIPHVERNGPHYSSAPTRHQSFPTRRNSAAPRAITPE